MRNAITLHIGQAGVEIGAACWKVLCAEHGIKTDGSSVGGVAEGNDNGAIGALFSETPDGRYIPRSVLVDLEPGIIDKVRKGEYGKLFRPEQFIIDQEDAGDVFASGYCRKRAISSVHECLRHLTEECDSLEGFIISHSVCGGTGSGFTTKAVELLSEEYEKETKHTVSVFPSPMNTKNTLEPYNTVLSAYTTLEHVNCSFLVDNEAIMDICYRALPSEDGNTYNNANEILAKVVSSVTTSLRFDCALKADLTEFQTNLVPYPRMHFSVVAYSPVIAANASGRRLFSEMDMTQACFENDGQLLKCNVREGHYLGACLLYRGDVVLKNINDAIQEIKTKGESKFVNWCPTKVGLCHRSPAVVPNSDMAHTSRALCTIANTTALSKTWAHIIQKFDKLIAKRSFLYPYVVNGMEEAFFSEAREEIGVLQKQYEEAAGGGEETAG